ncbi:MAG: hypothetical protein N3F05_04830 [Candidatus Diapherotrites archaeon]|nr:hypothetical protein [Candidatus Diapherotrites archaeon]
MPRRPIVPKNRVSPKDKKQGNKQNRGNMKPRPVVLQRIKGFEANLMLIPEVFRKAGIVGCVEVVRTAIPELERKVREEIANGAVFNGNLRAIFIEKVAEAMRRAGAKEAQVAEFRQKAWQAIS